VVIDAGMSLTLSAGGHHIVINAGGIFSSVAIVEGGAPMAGVAAQVALAAAAEDVVVESIPMEALLKQAIVFREADTGICPVCDAAERAEA
jgi:type VI secretion system secreted protein VgrG